MLPLLRKSQAGRIVNVSSGLGSLTQDRCGPWLSPVPDAEDMPSRLADAKILHDAARFKYRSTPLSFQRHSLASLQAHRISRHGVSALILIVREGHSLRSRRDAPGNRRVSAVMMDYQNGHDRGHGGTYHDNAGNDQISICLQIRSRRPGHRDTEYGDQDCAGH